jgi:hypothetical protein
VGAPPAAYRARFQRYERHQTPAIAE